MENKRYYGAPDAETVLAGMGSVSGTVMETIDYLHKSGCKIGYVNVRLFSPFSSKHFLGALPKTVKKNYGFRPGSGTGRHG
jgi:pyruvate-ferredoxin/flavodoxin oxidoreductase